MHAYSIAKCLIARHGVERAPEKSQQMEAEVWKLKVDAAKFSSSQVQRISPYPCRPDYIDTWLL